RARPRPDRNSAVPAAVRSIAERQRFTRTHSQRRERQFSAHEDGAHAHRRLWSALDRVAESQSRGRVGHQADDCVGTLERSSRAGKFESAGETDYRRAGAATFWAKCPRRFSYAYSDTDASAGRAQAVDEQTD